MKKYLKNEKAITLIALIVTIIILLILAGISITMLTGENGILNKTTNSKEKTIKQGVMEETRVDIMSKMIENAGENLTEDELKEILNKRFNNVPDSLYDKTQVMTTKERGIEVSLEEMLDGVVIARDGNESEEDLVAGATFTDGVRLTWDELKLESNAQKYDYLETGISNNGIVTPRNSNFPAFYNCDTIVKITLPKSATTFADYSFESCDSLVGIYVEPGNSYFVSKKGILYNKEMTKIIKYPSAKNDTTYNIPDSVTMLGICAFENCKNLTQITIPEGVTEIGNSVFYGTSISTIDLPSGLTSIGSMAFRTCRNLTKITIPDNVNYIGKYAFEYCSALKEINIPSKVTTINDSTFDSCSSLEKIVIPNSITSINNNAFYGCESLTEITIPNSVKTFGGGVFRGCKKLQSIVIPDSVTTMGDQNFYDCKELKSVKLSNKLTEIGSFNFGYCYLLEDITIPDSVTSIGNYAFYKCEKIKSLVVPDGVKKINMQTFMYCDSMTTITLPSGLTDIYNEAFYGSYNLKNINFKGTEEQWNNINKGSDWNKGMSGYTINYI